MKHLLSNFFMLAAAVGVCCLGSVAWASTNLPPVLVEAGRVGKTATELPASVQVITAEEIAASGCKSTVELLEKKANLLVRKMNANPAFSQIAMRGFGENSFGRTLVLVDGERLNNPDMSAPNLTRIPIDVISRIEIIHGPQTVLNGDNATAGVINIVTSEADQYDDKTTVGAAVGSYDTYRAHLAHRGGWAEEGVSYRASLDWEDSNGFRDNGGYTLWNANAGIAKNWENGSRVSLGSFYGYYDYEMPGSLTYAQYHSAHSHQAAQTPDDSARIYTYGLNLSARGYFSEKRYLEGALSLSRRATDWDNDAYTSHLVYDIYQYTFAPRYVDKTEWFGHENTFAVGVDLRYETLDYLSKGYSYGYKYRTSQDFSRLASGVYVQDEWFITDDLSLTLGARTERFHSHWDPKQSGRSNWDDHERAYEAALNYRPSEWSKLYLRGTRFYRAPFCDELNYAPKALDPETGYSAEFGASAQPAEEWLADVSLWTMWMKHELFYDPGIYYNWWWGANVNSPARTRRIGLDAMLRWAREKVASAALCYRYADSRFTEGEYDSNHTPLAPHHLIRLQGEVWATDWVALFAGVREVSSQYLAGDYGNDYPKLKPYALFDCGVRFYPFGDKLDDNLMVQFAVDNLTNRKYCDFAGASGGDTYYYPAEGRFYALSARYEF